MRPAAQVTEIALMQDWLKQNTKWPFASGTARRMAGGFSGSRYSCEEQTIAQPMHEGLRKRPRGLCAMHRQIAVVPQQATRQPARLGARSGMRHRRNPHALGPVRLRHGFNAALHPLCSALVSARIEMRTANTDKCEMTDRLERHQMQGHLQLAHGTVVIAFIGRQPSTPHPSPGRPWLDRQSALSQAIRLIQPA
jgi:hypothetical protein